MINLKEYPKDNYRIELKPNYSLVGFQRILFFAVIITTCLGIASFFWYLGAVLVLPFAGLELAVVGFGFYLNFRWSSQRELIFINPTKVKVEKGRVFKDFSFEEYRAFARFQTTIKSNGEKQLFLSSKGKNVRLASFLVQDEINELQDLLTKLVKRLNALPPSR
ncbi:MAG: hypothetical protein RI886_727 [Pseudomonadota bacterium]